MFEWLYEPVDYLMSPHYRVYWGYLLSSALLALGIWFVAYRQLSFKSFLFPKKLWLHSSSRQDFVLFILNAWLRVLVFIHLLVSSMGVSLWFVLKLQQGFGDVEPIQLPLFTIIFLYTLTLFLVGDFLRFFVHWLLHKIPVLWPLHRLHHTAEVLTPLTQYRSHPLEQLIFILRASVEVGLVTAVFFYLFKSQLTVLAVLGVNAFRFVFLLTANLRHSHIWLSWGKLGYLFISPAQHQIHHSKAPKHWDKNFGSALAIWDWMFGTLYVTGKKEKLDFGLSEGNESLKTQLLLPLAIGKNNE